MSRVNIWGQFPFEDIFTTWKISWVAQIESDAELSQVPRNWSEFCNSVNAQLIGYQALRNRFKIWCYSTLLIDAMFLGYSLISRFDPVAIVVPFFSIVMIPYFCFVAFLALRIIPIWIRIRNICEEKSGRGVEYELKNESFGGCVIITRRYFIVVHVDEEEQQAMDTPPVIPAPEATQNTTSIDVAHEQIAENSPQILASIGILPQQSLEQQPQDINEHTTTPILASIGVPPHQSFEQQLEHIQSNHERTMAPILASIGIPHIYPLSNN